VRVLLCSEAPLDEELASTLLFRAGMERHVATASKDVLEAARRVKPQIVLVDRDLKGAPLAVKALRENAETRGTSVVVLARGDFAASEFELLEAGGNAVLRLPPSGDWDDRLFRLMQVPHRREARVGVSLQLDLGLGATGETFTAQALNLSVNGMLIATGRPLQIGDDLTFALALREDGGLVRGGGTVVRQAEEPLRYGVELTQVAGDGRVQIKQYVNGL